MKTYRVLLKAEVALKAMNSNTIINNNKIWWRVPLHKGHYSVPMEKRDTTWPLLWKGFNLISLFSSVTQYCLTLWDPMNCSTPGLPVHHQLPEFTQTHVHWIGDAIQPSHPLSSPSPSAPIPPSIRVFSNESTLHMRWPKYWSFSFSISPSKDIPGLISFRMDWLDLLAVQGTLKHLLQHYKKHQFFSAQLSSQSNSHIHTRPLEKPWLDGPLLAK